MRLSLKLCLPFYFTLHIFIGFPVAVMVGIIGGLIDHTTYYLEMEMSNWIEEWIHPYRVLT